MLIECKFDNKNSNSSIPFLPIALVAIKFFSTLILYVNLTFFTLFLFYIMVKLIKSSIFMKIKKVKRGFYEAELELLTDNAKSIPDYQITDLLFINN